MSYNDSSNLENTEDRNQSDNLNNQIDMQDINIQIADNRDSNLRYDRYGQHIVKGGKVHRLSFADEINGPG